MPKTSLLRVVLGSSICIISVVSAGCRGSKDNDREPKSQAAKAAVRPQADAAMESSSAYAAQLSQQPPAQLLTPVKQTGLSRPIQATAGLADRTADGPPIADSLVAMEPAPRYGDQPISDESEQLNPLREPEQPGVAVLEAPATPGAAIVSEAPAEFSAAVPLQAPAEPGADPGALLLSKAETPPPGKQLPPKTKPADIPSEQIKQHDAIYAGWPEPKVALVITGMIDGYIEPCGCAGIDRMKGGMSRRFAMFKDLRQRGGRWSGWTWEDWPMGSAARPK